MVHASFRWQFLGHIQAGDLPGHVLDCGYDIGSSSDSDSEDVMAMLVHDFSNGDPGLLDAATRAMLANLRDFSDHTRAMLLRPTQLQHLMPEPPLIHISDDDSDDTPVPKRQRCDDELSDSDETLLMSLEQIIYQAHPEGEEL